MLNKVRYEMSYMVDSLFEEFEQSHKKQIENIMTEVNKIMKEERMENNKKMEKLRKEKTESLWKQKIKFKTKNVADIMYILCLERLRFNFEKQKIHNSFKVF